MADKRIVKLRLIRWAGPVASMGNIYTLILNFSWEISR